MSAAYPQPAPGAVPAPGPTDKLRGYLGVREVNYVQGQRPLAIVDTSL
jgi:hypothetical protein